MPAPGSPAANYLGRRQSELTGRLTRPFARDLRRALISIAPRRPISESWAVVSCLVAILNAFA